MTLLSLFWVFFQVGLFTIGGGLVAIPIIQQQVVSRGWISPEMFYHMIAISEATPGPIGVNMATYVGFERASYSGAVIATLGSILPCFLITIMVSKFFQRFNEKPLVKNGLYGVRAAVAGLIATAAFNVLTVTIFTWKNFIVSKNILNLFDYKQLIIFSLILSLYLIFKKHPIWYILLGAICGILFY